MWLLAFVFSFWIELVQNVPDSFGRGLRLLLASLRAQVLAQFPLPVFHYLEDKMKEICMHCICLLWVIQ